MEENKEMLYIIVPCYNEEEALQIFYPEAKWELDAMQEPNNNLCWKILVIDDGSNDNTLQVAKSLRLMDKRVHYLSFSRNFGKEAAICAGIQRALSDGADYIAVMDADMQDPPSLLPQMYQGVIEEGYDCVATRRKNRKGEPPIRSFFAHMFYRLINRISATSVVDGARDFRFMTRQVAQAIISLKEYNRFTKGIYEWVGFKTKYLEYENIERAAGDTKWSFWKLFKYSLEGIIAFSTAPLALASIGGIVLCVVSFLTILFLIIRAAVFGDPVAGWPSLACIVIFMGGIQLFCSGILGMYLSRTYLECKERPIYIIKEEV